MCMNRPIRAIDAEWTPPRRPSRIILALASAWDWITALVATIAFLPVAIAASMEEERDRRLLAEDGGRAHA